jgi:hypothetical protein
VSAVLITPQKGQIKEWRVFYRDVSQQSNNESGKIPDISHCLRPFAGILTPCGQTEVYPEGAGIKLVDITFR